MNGTLAAALVLGWLIPVAAVWSAENARPGLMLVQRRQMPLFSDRQPGSSSAAPQPQPTPRLELRSDPSRPGSYEARNLGTGTSYQVRRDPYMPGWYRLEDPAGRTMYRMRPGPSGTNTYEIEP